VWPDTDDDATYLMQSDAARALAGEVPL
jgi:hypothetical protein